MFIFQLSLSFWLFGFLFYVASICLADILLKVLLCSLSGKWFQIVCVSHVPTKRIGTRTATAKIVATVETLENMDSGTYMFYRIRFPLPFSLLRDHKSISFYSFLLISWKSLMRLVAHLLSGHLVQGWRYLSLQSFPRRLNCSVHCLCDHRLERGGLHTVRDLWELRE